MHENTTCNWDRVALQHVGGHPIDTTPALPIIAGTVCTMYVLTVHCLQGRANMSTYPTFDTTHLKRSGRWLAQAQTRRPPLDSPIMASLHTQNTIKAIALITENGGNRIDWCKCLLNTFTVSSNLLLTQSTHKQHPPCTHDARLHFSVTAVHLWGVVYLFSMRNSAAAWKSSKTFCFLSIIPISCHLSPYSLQRHAPRNIHTCKTITLSLHKHECSTVYSCQQALDAMLSY